MTDFNCSKCSVPLTDDNRLIKWKNGKIQNRKICMECIRKYDRQHYWKHNSEEDKIKRRIKKRKYYKENKESVYERNLKYIQSEKGLKAKKERRNSNPNKYRAYSNNFYLRYHEKNKERGKAKNKKAVSIMTNSYIRGVLKAKKGEVNNELIEAKRLQLKLKRMAHEAESKSV